MTIYDGLLCPECGGSKFREHFFPGQSDDGALYVVCLNCGWSDMLSQIVDDKQEEVYPYDEPY